MLGIARAPASSAHCDQGRTRFFARGMIARVVRLPAFAAGLKNELAQRFCCRCPACDPSTRRLPRVAVLAFFPVPSLRNVHKLSPRRLPSAPLLHPRHRHTSAAGGRLCRPARSPGCLGTCTCTSRSGALHRTSRTHIRLTYGCTRSAGAQVPSQPIGLAA